MRKTEQFKKELNLPYSMGRSAGRVILIVSIQMCYNQQDFFRKKTQKVFIMWKNLIKYSAVELLKALFSRPHLYLVPLRREQLL